MQNFDPSTLFIGRHLLHFPSVDSTNLVLKDMARSGNLPEGTLVMANVQTHGRGRQGRFWFGNAGQNVYASFLLRPQFLNLDQMAGISFCTSLAIADTLREFVPYGEIRIKWPNDVLLNGGKIAGILIESSIGNRTMDMVVAGVGINVNERDFPEDMPFATSMLQQSGQVFRIRDVVGVLCKKLEQRYQQCKKQAGIGQLCADYNKLLFSRGKKVTLVVDGESVEGVVREVDISGKIHIEFPDGMRSYNQGEIKLNAYGNSN